MRKYNKPTRLGLGGLALLTLLSLSCKPKEWFYETHGQYVRVREVSKDKILLMFDRNSDTYIDGNVLLKFGSYTKNGDVIFKVIGEANDLDGDYEFKSKGESKNLE